MTEATERRRPTGNPALSVAMLPFENLSGNHDHDYFSIGFVEHLNTDVDAICRSMTLN